MEGRYIGGELPWLTLYFSHTRHVVRLLLLKMTRVCGNDWPSHCTACMVPLAQRDAPLTLRVAAVNLTHAADARRALTELTTRVVGVDDEWAAVEHQDGDARPPVGLPWADIDELCHSQALRPRGGRAKRRLFRHAPRVAPSP